MMVEVNHWQGMQVMRNTAFREVHKNAWLKMVLVENKKRDKLWVVFCVHDDTDPFLEAYVDNKVAATHKPHWYMSLNNTLHITPTICPQDEEYEFVITLQTDVIRLTAPSWQLMIDWVETLRRKLLEMRILSPKENVYSKLPVTKNVTLLPTRDPTSPLPLPPTEPAAIVPGVEPPPVFNYDIESTSANHSGTSTSNSPTASSSSQTQPFTVNSTTTPSEMAAATMNPVATSSAHYEQLFLQSTANKVAVLKRAQRSVSNCEIPQNALQGGSTEPGSLMRRRSNSLMETNNAEDATNSGKRLTLRAQQVSQLQKEIMHPGGVRLRLRRRDCVNSIALVDACSGVWIAGWKQREHPMLYNALHIGDQLVSVEGVAITKASDAHRILRNASTGLFVELVVKRLPFGQVYAIRRDVEGQCLGLVQEDSSAVLKDVLPDGLAARHGLFPKAQTMDGLSLTNWVLTEINGRPLNLFFKDNEVRDRLNSVGRDISILVQPLDLIKQLKKQLKSMRNYKDYLLQ